jgi:hypothetical protein
LPEVGLVGFIRGKTDLSTFDMVECLSTLKKNCVENILVIEGIWLLVQLKFYLLPTFLFIVQCKYVGFEHPDRLVPFL